MRQFNFRRHWPHKIRPLLGKPAVVRALHAGMVLYDLSFMPGDPPWLLGRGPMNGQRAREGCLSWYQPWGLCHYIAPFSHALGLELFPGLKWGFVTSDAHTVAVGYQDGWERPEWVLDILLFRGKSADESLAMARTQEWRFFPCLVEYMASFCTDPEAGLEALQGIGN